MSLEEEQKKLISLLSKAKADLDKAPKGELRLSKSNGHLQFYNGKTYIPKKERELIRQLAQKRYDRAVIKTVGELLRQIEVFNSNYNFDRLDNLKTEIDPEVQNIISPYWLSNEEFASKWTCEQYVSKEKTGMFSTINGEKVRSKSEVIIADRLSFAGIPYRYEEQTVIKIKGTYCYFYPDFTILNKRTRQVFILEHFGMMDNPDYAEKAISKINTYEENGYLLGKNILFTFETSIHPLSTFSVNQLIKNYLT